MPDIFLYPGEANPDDVKLRDPTTGEGGAPPVTGTATWDQVAASWDATAAEAFSGIASFDQAPATWDAVASERFTSTAEFVQAAATWDAAALERLTAIADWLQTAAWDASADVAGGPVTGTATFDQAAATWAASAFTPSAEVDVGAVEMRRPPLDIVPSVAAAATFQQAPATWGAVMDVNNDEPLLFGDLLELVA